MDIKIIYEDSDVLVVDKPAGLIVFPEPKSSGGSEFPPANGVRPGSDPGLTPLSSTSSMMNELIEKYPELTGVGRLPRYGAVHRLDKDTSGILLVAKSNEALLFLQKQFKNREAEKNYITLATGVIKKDHEEIRTLIGRSPADPRKQKAHPIENPKSEIINPRQIQNIKSQNSRIRREAVTGYKVLRRYDKYTLLEAYPKTGRKHQIRCHMAYIHHPIAGDKLYGFKDSPTPEGLKRHFLHATYLKIQLPSGETKEFKSELPEELAKIIQNLKIKNQNDN